MSEKRILTEDEKQVINKLLKPDAPQWVVDGVLEHKNLGIPASAALARIKNSSFFNKEWLANN